MKNCIWIFLIIAINLSAQDTIRFRNGSLQAVKITEIGTTEIKYNKLDNLEGPLYIMNKNDVASIRYSNGEVESFSIVQESAPSWSSTNKVAEEDKIIFKRGRMYYRGRGLGEIKLQRLISNTTDANKQDRMLEAMRESKLHKKNQYLFGFVGLGIGLFSIPVGIIAGGVQEDFMPFFISINAGAAIGITGAVLSGNQKRARLRKMREAAKIYNGEM